jgi:hypothetical protein
MNAIESLIEPCARAAHEVNRAYCLALGDTSQAPWDHAPAWQRESARRGVRGVLLDGNGPGASHASWLAEKTRAGWKYAPIKNAAKKEHPCMVPFEELPIEQRYKDVLFVAVVRQVATAIRKEPIEGEAAHYQSETEG